MRTHTPIAVLLFVTMAGIPRDAGALWLTLPQAPETDSLAALTDVPPNIAVSTTLQDVVAQMLRESETFRRQLRLIDSLQRVRVRIMLEDHTGPARQRAARAQCELARYEFGGITALCASGLARMRSS